MDLIEVTLQRDYSQGTEPTRFQRAIPKELEDRGVTEAEFLNLVDATNDIFREAETVGWKTLVEGLLGWLTFFSLFLFYDNTYKRQMKRLELFLHDQNAQVFLPKGVRVKNPLFNGLLYMEFVVYPNYK